MSYVDQNLISGEVVLYRTRLHWISMIGHVIAGAVFGFLGLILAAVGLSNMKQNAGSLLAGLVFVVVALGFIWLGKLRRNSVEMAVTNKRVIIKVGIISKRTVELFLPKVESVAVNQGILGRMLGFGSLIVRGTGGTAEPFRLVASPEEFRHQVQNHMEMATR